MLAWLPVLPLALLAASQVAGWSPTRLSLYGIQALTPWLLLSAAPLAVLAVVGRRWGLAIVATLCLTTLIWLSLPLIRPALPRPDPPAAPHLTVVFANALAGNARPADASAAILAAVADAEARGRPVDVVAVAELTPELVAALVDGGVRDLFPYEALDARPNPQGIGLWSARPLRDAEVAPIGPDGQGQIGIVATVQARPIDSVDTSGADSASVRVVVAHPVPPLSARSAAAWAPSIRAVGDLLVDGDGPAVAVADLNASWWHPEFRRLLGRGLTDAHQDLGQGWSVSWPADRHLPPFVRLDHAVSNAGLVPLHVSDFAVPGSDHRGFVVTWVVRATT